MIMEEKTNYEVTISCPDDSMYATSKTFDELDNALAFIRNEIVEELKVGDEISIMVTKL